MSGAPVLFPSGMLREAPVKDIWDWPCMPSIVPAVKDISRHQVEALASVAECHHVPSHVQDGDRHLMDDDEEDAALDDSIVRDFHFGGGFVQKKRSDGASEADEEAAEPRKSKKEVSPCFCWTLSLGNLAG